MKKLITGALVFFAALFTANAQQYDDRDFYGEEFDWRWDVRVRISDGINNGRISNWEANRLYDRLERIESKEYDYFRDGVYDRWEQDDVWDDVQRLHRKIGIDLRDYDRAFYGYSVVLRTYPFWFNRGGYSFNRFDTWGWGSRRYGYAPRRFHRNHYVYHNYNGQRQRVVYNNRGVSSRGRVAVNNSKARSNRNYNATVRNGSRRTNSPNGNVSRSNSNRNSSRVGTTPSRSSSRVATPSRSSSRVSTPSRSTQRVSTPSRSSSRVSTPSRSSSRVSTSRSTAPSRSSSSVNRSSSSSRSSSATRSSRTSSSSSRSSRSSR